MDLEPCSGEVSRHRQAHRAAGAEEGDCAIAFGHHGLGTPPWRRLCAVEEPLGLTEEALDQLERLLGLLELPRFSWTERLKRP
jgi:hypothetical protein